MTNPMPTKDMIPEPGLTPQQFRRLSNELWEFLYACRYNQNMVYSMPEGVIYSPVAYCAYTLARHDHSVNRKKKPHLRGVSFIRLRLPQPLR